MTVFGWIADGLDPPPRWDLRTRGWTLCRRPYAERRTCTHPLLVDVRPTAAAEQLALVERGQAAARWLILLGVEKSAHRASLLARGCAEALPAQTELEELEARARRVAELGAMLPRSRPVGPLMLDLFHRDARLGPNWLALHPREFGLLWRLADEPGERVTRRDLLRDVWRIQHEPETNSVEVHVSRLRSKLAGVGCEALVETATEGGYRLAADADVSGNPDPLRALARSAFAPPAHLPDS
jgi:DNA-binding response OmpR family regulator